MNNIEIRMLMKAKRLRQYHIAKIMGVHESTVCRWFREELQADKKEAIIKAIREME